MSKKTSKRNQDKADVITIHGSTLRSLGAVATFRQLPGNDHPLRKLDEPEAQVVYRRDARVFHEWIRTHVPYGTYEALARLMAERLGVKWPWVKVS
jgi:hypothetical protein